MSLTRKDKPATMSIGTQNTVQLMTTLHNISSRITGTTRESTLTPKLGRFTMATILKNMEILIMMAMGITFITLSMGTMSTLSWKGLELMKRCGS